MISIVSPIYNEERSLKELYQRFTDTFTSMGEADYEIIFIDNGSTDNSLGIITQLKANDQRIKYISLSRNFGHQGGITAGLENAQGDAVISIDGDLQQPPELISEMIDLWRSGYDVVCTIKTKSNRNFIRLISTSIFYRILSNISDLNLTYGQSDYRLLDRKVVDVLKAIPEKDKFLRGLVDWMGFKQAIVEYTPEERLYGKSKFSLKNYLHFALNGIFSYSAFPLRIVLWCGVTLAAFCIMYAVFAFLLGVLYFLDADVVIPPGWASIAVSITFLSGIQLIGIGLLGEYVARTYTQTKQRPDYIIREIDLS